MGKNRRKRILGIVIVLISSGLLGCTHSSKTFRACIDHGGQNHCFEHSIYDRKLGKVKIGLLSSGREGRVVNGTYKFHFNLTDMDNFYYGYISIDAEEVKWPQHKILLNGNPIGYLERGYSYNAGGTVFAGSKKRPRSKPVSRTQRYLPARYFKKGRNTLEIKHQKLRSTSGKYQWAYETFYIDDIYLAIVRNFTSTAAVDIASSNVSRHHFPGHLKFLSELTDEELYLTLVKLPSLITELSYPGSVNSRHLSYVYSRIGDYHRWTGDYTKNLQYQKKATGFADGKTAPLLLPFLQSRLALAHYYVGDYQNAIKEGEAALEQIETFDEEKIRQLGNQLKEDPQQLKFLAEAYLAIFYFHAGDKSWSEYYAFRVINHFDDDWGYFGNRKTRMGKYLPLAIAYQTAGDNESKSQNYEKSLKYYRKALEYLNYEVRPEIYNDQMINIQLSIARALYHTGAHAEALKVLSSTSNPTNEFLWRSHLLQGMISEKQGNLQAAADQYLQSISEIEFSRAKLTSHGLKINFMTDKQQPYARMVHCLVRLNRNHEAFNYVEKAKARAFLDLLASTGEVLGQKNQRLSALTDEEKRLRETLLNIQNRMDMQRELFNERGSDDNGRDELRDAQQALSAFYAKQVDGGNMEFVSLRAADTVDVKGIQSVLPPNTALAEYFYHDQWLYVWVIDRKGSRFVKKKIKSDELQHLVTRFRELTARPGEVRGLSVVHPSTAKASSLQRSYHEVNSRLHKLLVDGVIDGTSAKKLYIVPHGILHYLPFQAIYTSEGYFIEAHPVGYVPSASVLNFVFQKRRQRASQVLALGNPELGSARMALPFAEKEVQDIQKVFAGTTVLTGPKASEYNFKKSASNYDILHIASHGEFNADAPLLSCLRLAPGQGEDGRLETREIFNLDLKAYLVTLSACNTAMGKMSSGDELMGLTRAFIYAGTPSILGTFWSVSDESTRVLMKQFYANLSNMDKLAAMQKAQISMLKNKRFEHPHYWAGFQVIGDLN